MHAHRRHLALVAALILSIAAPAAWGAEASGPALPSPQDEMIKIVYRSTRPGLPPEHTDAKPKTLYRVGERWGRIEHPENPVLHPLVIVASPDVWFIDLRKKAARHSLDPGPRFAFRAPLVQGLREGMPREILDLEFGRELEFMETRGATKERKKTPEGQELDVYQATVGDLNVVISTLPDTRDVRSALIYRDKTIFEAFLYDAYQRGLPADPALFQLPEGIQVVREAGVEGSKPEAAQKKTQKKSK